MATRALLAELAEACQEARGRAVRFESVGGVDAAKRVAAGEAFDLVVLAADAIDQLIAGGHVRAGSRTDLVRSSVAIAVRAGASRPDIGSEDALKRAVLAARTIGYSTGPSGVALGRLFERWGIAGTIASRIVTPPPGVPVGSLVAKGEVELGFQQRSELMNLEGIAVIGPMPHEIEIVTTFSGGVCTASAQPDAARGVLDFLASPATREAKRRHGMDPVGGDNA